MSEHSSGRIVVGVSQSLAGLETLRYAVAEARRRGAPLQAVRAWHLAEPWQGPDVRRTRRQLGHEALRYVYDAFDAAMGGRPTDIDLTVTAANGRADRILSEMARDRRDLLVLGGRTGRRRTSWLVRGCTRRAACPVTVVPPHELARGIDDAASVRRLLREAERYTVDKRMPAAGAP